MVCVRAARIISTAPLRLGSSANFPNTCGGTRHKSTAHIHPPNWLLGEKERKVVCVRCGLHISRRRVRGRRRCGGGVGGAAAISPLKRILAFPWERRPRGGGVFQCEGLYKKDDYTTIHIVCAALASTTPAVVYGRCCVSNPRGRYHPLRSVPAPWGREREREKRASVIGKARTSGCFSIRRWRQDAGTWQNGDYFPISQCNKGVAAGPPDHPRARTCRDQRPCN